MYKVIENAEYEASLSRPGPGIQIFKLNEFENVSCKNYPGGLSAP